MSIMSISTQLVVQLSSVLNLQLVDERESEGAETANGDFCLSGGARRGKGETGREIAAGRGKEEVLWGKRRSVP